MLSHTYIQALGPVLILSSSKSNAEIAFTINTEQFAITFSRLAYTLCSFMLLHIYCYLQSWNAFEIIYQVN